MFHCCVTLFPYHRLWRAASGRSWHFVAYEDVSILNMFKSGVIGALWRGPHGPFPFSVKNEEKPRFHRLKLAINLLTLGKISNFATCCTCASRAHVCARGCSRVRHIIGNLLIMTTAIVSPALPALHRSTGSPRSGVPPCLYPC